MRSFPKTALSYKSHTRSFTTRLYTGQLAYLTYTQNASCKMLRWMNHKLEARLPGEISRTLDMQMMMA